VNTPLLDGQLLSLILLALSIAAALLLVVWLS
jgi:hypothetical protein